MSVAAGYPQFAQIVEGVHLGGFFRCNVEHDDVRAFDPQLGRRDQEDAQFPGAGERAFVMEDFAMQRDGQSIEATGTCASSSNSNAV